MANKPKIKHVYAKCNPEAAQDLQTATAVLMKVVEVMIDEPSAISGNAIKEAMYFGKAAIEKSVA